MDSDRAECGNLGRWLAQIGGDLDRYLKFEHPDAMHEPDRWRAVLAQPLPDRGVGIAAVMDEIGRYLIPNGSQIPNPGSTAFITTGAASVGALATVAGAVASPQRLGLTAFSFLEELSLQWMAELFELPPGMKGLYSSGGSVANLVALGAARQAAFEGMASTRPATACAGRAVSTPPRPATTRSGARRRCWAWGAKRW